MAFNHIYLIRCSETAPTDGEGVRLLRTGQMYSIFARDYPCTWLVSTFDHYGRAQRFQRTTRRSEGGGTIVFVRTPGYGASVSLRRLYDHFVFGVKAAAWLLRRVTDADILIIGMPTVTAAFLGVLVARIKGSVAVVEVRDKWPDVFWYGQAGIRRWFIRVASAPLSAMVKFALHNALLVTTPSREYKEWVIQRFGVAASSVMVSPLGYQRSGRHAPSAAATVFFQGLLARAGGRKVACFFGTIGRMFDIETAVKYAVAQQDGSDREQQLYFVFLGGGDYLQSWRERVVGSPFVEFPGWASMDVLDAVAAASTVALAPYRNTPNFEGHVPNKIMEYLSYGLPIVTCMRGEVREIVEQNGLGAYYEEGDTVSFGAAVRKAAALDEDARRRAREYFQAHFDAETVYRQLLEEVEARRGAAGHDR